MRVVFADTGKGIPETVRKKLLEKMMIVINQYISVSRLKVSDGDLIKSALQGEFRSQTNQSYRGNGLNTVRVQIMTDKFRSFNVISGHGKCSLVISLDGEKNLNSQKFKHNMHGTLYTFDVCRGKNDEKNKNM